MKKISRPYSIAYGLIFLSFIDLFTHFLPPVIYALLLLMMMFLFLNRNEKIYVCLLVLSVPIGSFFYMYSVRGVGGYVYILGLFFFLLNVIERKIQVKGYKSAFISLFAIFVMLFFSVITSYGGDYAPQKLRYTIMMGILSFIAFDTLFTSMKNVDVRFLSLYLLLLSYMVLRSSIEVNNIAGPSSVFDLGFLRNQTRTNDIFQLGEEGFRLSYHLPGAIALQAFGIFCLKNKLTSKVSLVFIVLTSIPILYSGARQSIVVFFLMLMIKFLLDEKNARTFSKMIIMLIVTVCIGGIIHYMSKDGGLFSSVAHGGMLEGGNRDVDFLRGIMNFINSPIFGIGYGRDSLMGEYNQYAHNIVLELLGETGLVGFLLVFFVFIRCYRKCKGSVDVWLILFLAFIGPAMFSSGFDTNIRVVSFILAVSCSFNNKKITN